MGFPQVSRSTGKRKFDEEILAVKKEPSMQSLADATAGLSIAQRATARRNRGTRHHPPEIRTRRTLPSQSIWEQAKELEEKLYGAPKEHKPKKLLRLPPELRNQIWREVLLSSEWVDIGDRSNPLAEPGLLHTSRSVREETKGIFYLENTFKVDITDFDATILGLWATRSAYGNSYFKVRCKSNPIQIIVAPSSNWANLKKWIKDAYHRKSFTLAERDSHKQYAGGSASVPQRMFTVMTREKKAGASWEKIEERLEDMRGAMGHVSPEWRDS